jgi:hypothetical protein
MNTARSHPLASALLSLAVLFLLASCQPPKRTLTGSGMDMFTPVKMRLHPLSRIVTPPAPAEPIAEARIELMDQFDDICKGAGAVYCELFVYSGFGQNHRGERIGVWNFDLNKPEANKQHWDGITRTYLLKLPLPTGSSVALKKQAKVVLAATWTLPNGNRLTDDITLGLK